MGLRKDAAHDFRHVAVQEFRGRHVDRKAQRPVALLVDPAGEVRDGPEAAFAEFQQQPGALGGLYESARGLPAEQGMVPPDERLGADPFAGR
jgi:hypothetical protein